MNYLIFLLKRDRFLFTTALLASLLFGAFGGGCETLDEDYYLDDEFSEVKYEAIVDGVAVIDTEFTGVLALRMKSSICTGTLIDANVVLTAGHCVHYMDFNIVEEPESVTVYGGPQMGHLLAHAVQIIPHPDWKGKIGKKSVDLALIILDESIDNVTTYCVRSQDKYKIGTKGIIAGYGRESSKGRSGTLRAGLTTILAKNKSLLEIGNPTSTCLGDSGGPFFTQLKNDQYALAGVTSFGDTSCSPKGGGFNVNVVTYRNWMRKAVKSFTGRTFPTCKNEDKVSESPTLPSTVNRDANETTVVDPSALENPDYNEEECDGVTDDLSCAPSVAQADEDGSDVSCTMSALKKRSAKPFISFIAGVLF